MAATSYHAADRTTSNSPHFRTFCEEGGWQAVPPRSGPDSGGGWTTRVGHPVAKADIEEGCMRIVFRCDPQAFHFPHRQVAHPLFSAKSPYSTHKSDAREAERDQSQQSGARSAPDVSSERDRAADRSGAAKRDDKRAELSMGCVPRFTGRELSNRKETRNENTEVLRISPHTGLVGGIGRGICRLYLRRPSSPGRASAQT